MDDQIWKYFFCQINFTSLLIVLPVAFSTSLYVARFQFHKNQILFKIKSTTTQRILHSKINISTRPQRSHSYISQSSVSVVERDFVGENNVPRRNLKIRGVAGLILKKMAGTGIFIVSSVSI